jgi:hypothetical protein
MKHVGKKRHRKDKSNSIDDPSSDDSSSNDEEENELRKLRKENVDKESDEEAQEEDEEEEEEDQKKHIKGDEERELLLFEDKPFEIIPPPQQPAGIKRRGTGYINANLPQPPFMVLMVGPRKTGKTVCLYNMLQNRIGAYGRAFIRSNIILFSPTMQFDKTLEGLHLKWTYGPPTTVDSIIAHIKQSQNVYRQTSTMADILLVLEDVTNIPEVWQTMKDLGFTGRHFGIHTIAIAHKMSSINRAVRTQTQQWMLFKPHEESETEWILYTFARRRTKDIFEVAFARAWDIKFNFIYIDFERDGGIENIYRSGFNNPLFTPQEIADLQSVKLYRPSGEVAIEAEQEDEKLPDPDKSVRASKGAAVKKLPLPTPSSHSSKKRKTNVNKR